MYHLSRSTQLRIDYRYINPLKSCAAYFSLDCLHIYIYAEHNTNRVPLGRNLILDCEFEVTIEDDSLKNSKMRYLMPKHSVGIVFICQEASRAKHYDLRSEGLQLKFAVVFVLLLKDKFSDWFIALFKFAFRDNAFWSYYFCRW